MKTEYADLDANSNGCSLSVEENSPLSSVSFFPNPTQNNSEIANDKQLNLSVIIFMF